MTTMLPLNIWMKNMVYQRLIIPCIIKIYFVMMNTSKIIGILDLEKLKWWWKQKSIKKSSKKWKAIL